MISNAEYTKIREIIREEIKHIKEEIKPVIEEKETKPVIEKKEEEPKITITEIKEEPPRYYHHRYYGMGC